METGCRDAIFCVSKDNVKIKGWTKIGLAKKCFDRVRRFKFVSFRHISSETQNIASLHQGKHFFRSFWFLWFVQIIFVVTI